MELPKDYAYGLTPEMVSHKLGRNAPNVANGYSRGHLLVLFLAKFKLCTSNRILASYLC